MGLVTDETAGAFIAGPIGGVLGAAVGVVAASMVVWSTVLPLFWPMVSS
jgi:hypothetical protein